MLDLLPLMAARNDLHASAFGGRRRQRNPRRQHVRFIQAPIGRVLVPRDEARIVSILDKQRTALAQDVRPKHILNCVKNPRMADQIGDPGLSR